MKPARLRSLLTLALSTSLAACSGGGGPGGPQMPFGVTPPPSSAVIKHVIIVFQENRTPDNLFQGLAGADIATSGTTATGATVALQPIPLANTYDIEHTHGAFLSAYDGGKMDGANTVGTTCGTGCPYPNPQYGYVPPGDDAPYLTLASRFTFADRMFQTNQGPSYPAHQYIIAGTSQPSAGSPLRVSENGNFYNKGCQAPAGALVAEIDPSGSENHATYPCFEHATLMDLLDAKGVSWKYYAPSLNDIWAAPNSIAHIRNGPDWSNVVTPQTTVLTDIASGTLPAVSWVIPSGLQSDHAQRTDGSGPSWVASIVNAIGSSAYWNDSVVFVTWDDWGGWYDHVAPPTIYNSYELGFRVPLLVISPYAKRGYVSHVTHEFGSILHFVESTWQLGSLGFTDARADDLGDCFDFAQTVTPYRTVAARYGAAYFLHNPASPRGPDDE